MLSHARVFWLEDASHRHARAMTTMQGPQQFLFPSRRQLKFGSHIPFRFGRSEWGLHRSRTAEAAQAPYRSDAVPHVQLLAQAITGTGTGTIARNTLNKRQTKLTTRCAGAAKERHPWTNRIGPSRLSHKFQQRAQPIRTLAVGLYVVFSFGCAWNL